MNNPFIFVSIFLIYFLFKSRYIVLCGPIFLIEYTGSCLDVIKQFAKTKPILGVCLGAQAIAVAFGFELYNLKRVMHGKQSNINILDKKSKIYQGLPQEILVGRYHSWAVKITDTDDFIITAQSEEDVIMSFEHKIYPLTAIQYHPESILTKDGQTILKNWITD